MSTHTDPLVSFLGLMRCFENVLIRDSEYKHLAIAIKIRLI
ncbi:MAG: hypothetical protein ACFE0I_02000 [Elainellaceae cyanobacterium]